MSRPPAGPMAGLTNSQALSVEDSQESTTRSAHQSDSPTPSSHLHTNPNDLNEDDDSFIDDGSQSMPATQHTNPSASQDLAGLSPAGSVTTRRIIRGEPGFYRMDENEEEDLSEYETHPPNSGANTSASIPSNSTGPQAVDTSGNSPIGEDDDTEIADANKENTSAHDSTKTPPPVHTGPYLDGDHFFHIGRSGHPELPWSVVKEAASHKTFPPVGTLWYRLPAWFRTSDLAHTFLLQTAVLDTIKASGITFPGPDFFSLSFRGDRRKDFVIGCATGDVVTSLRSLVFPIPAIHDNAPFVLENPNVGLALGARYVPVFCQTQGILPGTALNALEAKLAPKRKGGQGIWIVDAWAVNLHTGPPPADTISQFQLVALLFVAPPRGGNFSTPLTYEDFLGMPSHIGTSFLAYPGRLRCCKVCHGQFGFHTDEECTNTKVPCAVCNRVRAGHTGISCPKRQTPTVDTDEPEYEDESTFVYAPAGPMASSASASFPSPNTQSLGSQPVVPIIAPGHSSPYTSPRGRGRGGGFRGGPPRSYLQTVFRTHGSLSIHAPTGPTAGASSSLNGPTSGSAPGPSTQTSSGTERPQKRARQSKSLSSFRPALWILSVVPLLAITPAGDTVPESDDISSFSIVTLNCGKGGLRHRLFELSTASSQLLGSASIVCLQECNTLSADWTDSKGVQDALRLSTPPPFRAILSSDAGLLIRDTSISIVNHASGPRWAYALLAKPTPIVGVHKQIAIWSIHGPFTSAAWDPIAQAIEARPAPPNTPTFIGADWNSVPDPLIDSLNGTPTAVPWTAPAAAIASTDTIDLFRSLRPTDLSWTFARSTSHVDGTTHVSARRLDSIWGPPSVLPFITSTYVCSTSSDHRAVCISLTTTSPAPGPPPSDLPPYRPWSLHPGLWNDLDFIAALHHFAESYNPPTDLATATASSIWQAFHGDLRDFLRPLARYRGSTQSFSRHDLDAARAALDALDLRHPDAATLLPTLLLRWRSAQSAARATTHLRANGHTTASALRAGSWLFSSHRSASTRNFPPLMTSAGLTSSPRDQLHTFTAFYRALFSPRPPTPITPEARLTFLSSIQLRLSAPVAASIAIPFTIDELFHALKTANRHSSSGPDGVPYRVYMETFPASGPRLLDLANSLGTGETIILRARTVILSKAGDPSDPSNYRPITISDAYVRLLSRLVSGRLLRVGDSLLPWTQAAFLPGRRSSLVAGVLHGISDLQSQPNSPLCPPAMVIISLDQRKAYDRVDRDWLFAVLEALRLPSLLLNVLRALYSNPTTNISALGAYGDAIRMLVGVLQGDASSCILYNVSLQPLFDHLAAFNIGVPIPLLGTLTSLAFADDSLLFLTASSLGLAQVPTLLQCLYLYSQASGAELNLNKSTFWIHGIPDPAESTSITAICDALSAYGLSPAPPGGPRTHLGHPLPLRNPSPTTPSPLLARLTAIRSRAACFRTIGVDLLTRAQTANRFLGSRLWHTITVGPLPENFSELFQNALLPYLLGKRITVSMPNLTAPQTLGGFGLIDGDAMATALSLSFLRRFLLSPDQLGTWLRAGLVSYLAEKHHACPALLLVRSGHVFDEIRNARTRADGFFGRLAHALAVVDLGIDPSWTELPLAALLTLPWILPWTPAPGLSADKLGDLRRQDWITWGDVLWRCGVHVGERHRSVSHPLGLPPGRSVVPNGLRSPFSKQRPLAGPGLAGLWPTLWSGLPPRVRSTLSTLVTSDAYRPLSDPSVTVSKSWCPLSQDPLAVAFPWHLLTIYGTRLATSSTASIRRAAQSGPPRSPKWADPLSLLTKEAWTRIWSEVARLPLSATVRTTTLLVLNRTVWTYQVLRRPAPCPLGCLRDDTTSAKDDSPTHGFFLCPAANAVWIACLPLLSRLGCPCPAHITAPALLTAQGIPARFRPRFGLWRSVVLHVLYATRHAAASAVSGSASPPDFNHCARVDVLSRAGALVGELLSNAWARILRRSATHQPDAQAAFHRTWVAGGTFLHIASDNSVHFSVLPSE
ncbi:hypothetical protein CF326_g4044 [Tilletia indica]|nr:hypothetical protein CF326_g4044 [Tilletia indica]